MTDTLRFQLWSSPSQLEVPLTSVRRDADEVHVEVVFTPLVWVQVDAYSLFNLDPDDWEVRDRFDDDVDVIARMQLAPELALELPDDPDAIRRELLRIDADAPGHALLDPASWTVLEVLQDVAVPAGIAQGSLRQGVQTAAGAGTVIRDAVKEMLWEAEVAFTETGEGVVVDGGDRGWTMVALTREREQQLIVETRWQQVVPAERRSEVMRMITELNTELTVVWFVLDLDDGTISAQTGLTTPPEMIDEDIAAALIHPCVAAFERFLPAIEAIASGELDVADLHDQS